MLERGAIGLWVGGMMIGKGILNRRKQREQRFEMSDECHG